MSPERTSEREVPVLRALAITKRFGHIHALEAVDLEAHAGEVLGLVGDNGAGKSTLIKILTGVIGPDAGGLFVDEDPVRFRSPADARRRGIAAVFQDLAMVESLDVATNMFLGEIPRRGLFVNRRLMDREAAEMLGRMDVAVHSPRTPVGLLPAGHRQAVAIARAVRANAQVVVMDEPTASLGVSEKVRVTELIGWLKSEGRAVILVSHDLQMVLENADRIQVLRLGRTAGIRAAAASDRDELVGLITGSWG